MFQGLFVLVVASILVKEVVDIFKPVLPEVSRKYFWASIVLGVLTAFTLSLDIFKILGFAATIPYVGIVFTGLIISQGSNTVHDLINRITEVHDKEEQI